MVILHGDGGLVVYCTDGFLQHGVCVSMLNHVVSRVRFERSTAEIVYHRLLKYFSSCTPLICSLLFHFRIGIGYFLNSIIQLMTASCV